MTLQPYKTDVAVLILFFNRPDHLKKVFDEVRKARPSRLFLYQDGPRGERDMPGIEACRRVVENIDWQCDVHRKYQERNYGCDPSEYISQKWAFSIVDKCIVLEDDDVPSQSFFPFCKQMLDRYEHDNRVWMVAGFNPEENIDSPYDYMFTSVFSIWGWASWRRVIDTWDETYAFLDDPDAMRQLEGVMRQRRYCLDTLHACYDHRASGKAYYETIFWSSMLLNSGLAIMPTHNMINNLGATDGRPITPVRCRPCHAACADCSPCSVSTSTQPTYAIRVMWWRMWHSRTRCIAPTPTDIRGLRQDAHWRSCGSICATAISDIYTARWSTDCIRYSERQSIGDKILITENYSYETDNTHNTYYDNVYCP